MSETATAPVENVEAPTNSFDPDKIVEQARRELEEINRQIESAKGLKLNAETRIRDLSHKRDKTQKILNAMTPRAPRAPRAATAPKAEKSVAKKASAPAAKASQK